MVSILLSTVGMLSVLFSGTSGYILNTNADVNTLCENGGSICAQVDAICTNNNCSCSNPNFPVAGLLACIADGELSTGIVNDPIMTTINKVKVDFPFPCRFPLTFLTSVLRDQIGNDIGQCNIEIRASVGKDIGKMYVTSFDMAIKLTYRTATNHRVCMRVMGSASNGSYQYEVLAKNGRARRDGPWGTDDPNYYDPTTGVAIMVNVDDLRNLFFVTLPNCGAKILIRHYDVAKRRDQTYVPGVEFIVDSTFGKIKYRGKNVNLAFIPEGQSNHYKVTDVVPGAPKLTGLAMQWAMSEVAQNSPVPNSNCEPAMLSLRLCGVGGIEEAMNACAWILKSPRFIRCYDNSTAGEDIMLLFTQCINMYCGNPQVTCNTVQAMLTGCETVTGYPKLDKFVAGDLCPPIPPP